MQYDIIVLGATFTAAGIAQRHKNKCLIAEKATIAGSEFLGALNFGYDYTQKPVSEEATTLLHMFEQKNAFNDGRVCLYDCAAPFYKLLESQNILLGTQIISVDKDKDGFICTFHSVSGYRTFKAKTVIDTRTHKNMCKSKTYNFIVDGVGALNDIPDVICEKWGFESNYILRLPVSLEADYTQAHAEVKKCIEKLPEGFKLLYMADSFDYEVKPGYPIYSNEINYMPSKAYKNPVLAFDAGALFEVGGNV